jgi:Ca2+-binding RTX toxin-like protein
MTGRSRRGLLLTLGCLCVWPATAARAATVGITGERLVVTGAPGERNDVVVGLDGDRYVVSDSGAPPVAADGTCAPGDRADVVVCPGASVTALDLVLGDADDRVDIRVPLPARIDGGPGNDTLGGGPLDDVLIGGVGADLILAGAGRDIVRYDDGLHDGGVAVSLSGGANDGSPGEEDDVREVEVVEGTPGADYVLGTDGVEVFNGGAGDDVGELLAGDDTFAGGDGDDACILEVGNDVCDGGPGQRDLAAYRTSRPLRVTLDGRADDGPVGATGNVFAVEEVVGGEGPDVIVGGAAGEELSGRGGNDTVLGGPGDDIVAGDRGADVLGGGDGRDRVAYSSVFVAAPARVTIDGSADDGVPGEGDRIGRDIEVVEGTTTGGDVLVAGGHGVELRGLGGNDRLAGGPAGDVLDAGEGDDLLSALDGVRDVLRCGPGLDAVVADDVDVLSGCEPHLREVPGFPRARVARVHPVLELVWSCPRAFRAPLPPRRASCRGSALLRLRSGVVLARARFEVPSGQRRRVRFHIPLRARRRVRGRVEARLVGRLPGVPARVTTVPITLVRR